MKKRKSPASLDNAFLNLDPEILRQKLVQLADFIYQLEKKHAYVLGMLKAFRSPSRPPDEESLRSCFPKFLREVVLLLGCIPSYLAAEGKTLVAENPTAVANIRRYLSALKRFVAIPKVKWDRFPLQEKTEVMDAVVELYLLMVQEFLMLLRQLRDRMDGELHTRASFPKITHRKRDRQLRDKRLKELAAKNPQALPAELFRIACEDDQIQAILQRGYVTLKSKETIRNVLKPNRGKKARQKTASSRNHQKTVHRTPKL